jgi:16S rRNA (cytidine1402-2'-O)-methyltransferase
LSGRLILCATPIGNLDDMSQRAVRTLSEADVIACEDTRRSRKLLTHFGVKASDLVVYNDANERRQAGRLIEHIERGRTVVLVSDAGTPGLSDPGYRLVRACAERGLEVGIIPGPNAAISALAISGLAPGRYVFEGFLARRSSERRRRAEELRDEERTLVIYESPHRIEECLTDLFEVLGPRRAALVRELTKMHEEVRRGTLPELLEGVRSDPVRGEIVLVIEGALGESREEVPAAELARRARLLMEQGMDRKEALSRVAKEAGVPRRKVFDALLES